MTDEIAAVRAALLATVFFAVAAPVVAAAQGAPEQVAAPEIADNGDIIITAQRRTETAQASAAALDVLQGSELDRRGIVTINDLQYALTSVHSGSFGGGTNIAIRGVGATTGGPGVAVNVDGVYQTQATTPDLAQIDLQRVEVLRGPQGTLYGRNANAGAVNFITNAPAAKLGASFTAGYAEYNEYHLQGLVNLPASDSVRMRLVVDYRNRQDGFVKNVDPAGQDLDKGDALSARFRLAANLASNLDFDLGVSVAHDTGPTLYLTNYTTPAPIAFILNPFLANATFLSTPLRTNNNDPSDRTRDYESASGTFTWRLPFATVKSITAFQRYLNSYYGDGDGTNISIAPFGGRTLDKAFTQEIDLNGTAGPVDWVAGLFYLREWNDTSLHYLFPFGLTGLPPESYFDFTQPTYDTTSYAGFADLTYHLTPKLKLIAGARYSEDRQKTTYGAAFGVVVAGTKVFLGDICPQETDRLNFGSFTPRAGAQYDFDSKKSVYFTWSRGFKAGGANTFSCANDFNPEQITSYEVGFKSRLFDDHLTLNAWAFRYDYTNFQVSQVVGLALQVTNAAAATINGVELETVWKPDSHWSLNASYAFLDATYSKFSNTDGLNPGPGEQDLAGNPLNNAPRNSANLGVAYRTDPLSFGRITARADGSYRSRTYFREFAAELDSQGPMAMVNLNLIWDSPDQRYSARAYVTNLTNKGYIQSLISSSSVGARAVTWGAPRQIGGEITARF